MYLVLEKNKIYIKRKEKEDVGEKRRNNTK